MAALTATQQGLRQVEGRNVKLTFTTSATGNGAADEWVPTGLSLIESAEVTVLGTTPASVSAVYNAQGTGVSAGTNPGDLGVETSAAVTAGLSVKVTGRL